MDTESLDMKATSTVTPDAVSPSFCAKEERHWFPMRVTYAREMAVKSFLDEQGVECFVPMHYESVEGKHPRYQELRPAVHNLIFLHATRKQITEMKMTKREMAAIRYIMCPRYDAKGNMIGQDVMTVPDGQMSNFMRVASITDDRVFYIENLDFAGKAGQRVKVVAGDFAGIEGVIKRVKKNRCVVVQIEHVAAVAIAFIPSAFLVTIDN